MSTIDKLTLSIRPINSSINTPTPTQSLTMLITKIFTDAYDFNNPHFISLFIKYVDDLALDVPGDLQDHLLQTLTHTLHNLFIYLF